MNAGERHSHHAETLRQLLAHEVARHEDGYIADRTAGAMVDAIIAMTGALLAERLAIHETADDTTELQFCSE